jgi:3-deoxy-D-manno-octulosonate 8-phosphate phosphatase (KDO 8-P phosphatase)
MDGMVIEPRGISLSEAAARARRIRLVLTDCDGVLTDTGVYYGPQGEVLKRFSVRDGMGTELLRREGIETGIVTAETSEAVRQRARKLEINHLHLGVRSKEDLLDEILQGTGLVLSEIAYIGDDVNDVAIMRRVAGQGLTGAPADAMPPALQVAHFAGRVSGGRGAFREFGDWILQWRAIGKIMPGVLSAREKEVKPS